MYEKNMHVSLVFIFYLLDDLKDQFNNVLPVQKFIPMCCS